MKSGWAFRVLLAVGTCFLPVPALAYVGPGLGAGVVASILGILAGLAMLVVGVVWYPLKRLFQRLRSKK